MVKKLHLFRHGETSWNADRRLQGHTDIPLNEVGKAQAASLQAYFSAHPVEIFFSSDLRRAQETASIANAKLRKPIVTSSALRESFLGVIEGKTRDEVQTIYGTEAWARWNSVSPTDRDFAYENAETARQTSARVSTALESFCQSHDFKEAGVCTHGMVLRRLLHSLRPEMTTVLPVPNCVVYVVSWSLEGFLFDAV